MRKIAMTVVDLSKFRARKSAPVAPRGAGPDGRFSSFDAGQAIEQGPLMGKPGLAGRIQRYMLSAAGRDVFRVRWEDGSIATVSHVNLLTAGPFARSRLEAAERAEAEMRAAQEEDTAPEDEPGFGPGF